MRKDYAKLKSKVSTKQRPKFKKKRSENRLWWLVIFLIVIFIFGLIFLKQQANKSPTHKEEKKPQNSVAVTKKSSAPAQPRFDFYTLLPSAQVATSENSQAKQNNTPPENQTFTDTTGKKSKAHISGEKTTPISATTPTTQAEISALEEKQLAQELDAAIKAAPTYAIQLGVFKDYMLADEQRAQFLMAGIDVKLKSVTKNNATRYRLWLGPYKSRAQAEQMQQKLKPYQPKIIVLSQP